MSQIMPTIAGSPDDFPPRILAARIDRDASGNLGLQEQADEALLINDATAAVRKHQVERRRPTTQLPRLESRREGWADWNGSVACIRLRRSNRAPTIGALRNREARRLEIYMIPGKAANLAGAKSGKHDDAQEDRKPRFLIA